MPGELTAMQQIHTLGNPVVVLQHFRRGNRQRHEDPKGAELLAQGARTAHVVPAQPQIISTVRGRFPWVCIKGPLKTNNEIEDILYN